MGKSILICLIALACCRQVSAVTLTNTQEIVRGFRTSRADLQKFELTGQIVSAISTNFPHVTTIRDDAGYAPVTLSREIFRFLSPGDHVTCKGHFCQSDSEMSLPMVVSATVLSHDAVPPPPDVTPDDIYAGKCRYAIVRLTGTVIDVFQDEANAQYSFVVLSVNGSPISMPTTAIPLERLNPLVGATVSIVGRCSAYLGFGPRAKLEYEVYIESEDSIEVLVPPPDDPFAVPVFEGNVYPIIHPKSGDSMRRRISGRVAARARDNRLLLRTATGELSAVELLPDVPPPPLDAAIDAAGIAETDFYRLNLSRAVWRPSAESVPAFSAETAEASIHALYFDERGQRRFNADLNGRFVRVRGTIVDLDRKPNGNGVIYLREGDDGISVDAMATDGALNGLEPGCQVEVTGLCFAEAENWRLQAPFPHIRAMSLVLRSPGDIRVIVRPPWWTPAKLRQAILTLFLAIVLLVAYSSVLTRVIRRRTDELDRERRTREHADIKKIERTHLAIELHDSLAQSINSCTMEVEAALEIGAADVPAMVAQVEMARRSLQFCREELRNSIWDLRSDALEESTLERAILRTLTPLVNKARLAVKFAVPRDRLSDNTCHAVIKIIRELTLNALRHGRAKLVRIAGKAEADALFFSVIDDGSGFDVDNRPGVPEGHFGLQGVKERVKSLGGAFTLASEPGRGTKARVTIPLGQETA